jgi:hypothetical protein
MGWKSIQPPLVALPPPDPFSMDILAYAVGCGWK